MKRKMLFVLLVLLISFILIDTGLAIDASFNLENPSPQAHALFGEAIIGIDDVNGDSVLDIAVAASAQKFSGYSSAGQVFVFSGIDRALLFTIDHPNPYFGSLFGSSLAVIDDINSDDVLDIVVGARWQRYNNIAGAGQAFVFSGIDGSFLFSLNDPSPQYMGFFGGSLAGIDDVNSDTIPDILVGTPRKDVAGNPKQGQAHVFSGADGALLYTLNDPNPMVIPGDPIPTYSALFGGSLAGIGDVDGDNISDFAVGSSFHNTHDFFHVGQVFVFSGVDGTLLHTLDDPYPHQNALFGGYLASIGDINGDSIIDLAVGAIWQKFSGVSKAGQGFVFSGADWSLLYTLNDPSPEGFGGFTQPLEGISDVNGDMLPDIATGATGHDIDGIADIGEAFIYSGADGALLYSFRSPIPQSRAGFAQTMAEVGDINGDTMPDLAVGARMQEVDGNTQQGEVFLFLLPSKNIEVTPLSWDFGNVAWMGIPQSTFINIANTGGQDLTVSNISLVDPLVDFSIGTLPSNVITPGNSVDLEVNFGPTYFGYQEGTLQISSDDPDEPEVFVALSGVGVLSDIPSEQVTAALDFIDDAVENGSLVGTKKKAIKTLKDMLEGFGDLLEDNLVEKACKQLTTKYKKFDGKDSPPDFVEGSSVETLRDVIDVMLVEQCGNLDVGAKCYTDGQCLSGFCDELVNKNQGKCVEVIDVTGDWTIEETGTENCETGSPNTYSWIDTVNFTQDGDTITATLLNAGESITGTISGNTFSYHRVEGIDPNVETWDAVIIFSETTFEGTMDYEAVGEGACTQNGEISGWR